MEFIILFLHGFYVLLAIFGIFSKYILLLGVIYIGKAKNIRTRIRSYFQQSNKMSPKTVTMLKHINDLEWIVVRNEVEALMTEANLIKKYKPRYNIDLRDDKSYPFIRITNEPYPQVFLTRKVVRDGSKYFGPFTDVSRLRVILKALYKVFPIRSDEGHVWQNRCIHCNILADVRWIGSSL